MERPSVLKQEDEAGAGAVEERLSSSNRWRPRSASDGVKNGLHPASGRGRDDDGDRWNRFRTLDLLGPHASSDYRINPIRFGKS